VVVVEGSACTVRETIATIAINNIFIVG